MNDDRFEVDRLEVDVLEPRLEMTQVALPPSTCILIINTGLVGAVETTAKDEIQKLTYSTCYPG